jgi:hypothetical protein
MKNFQVFEDCQGPGGNLAFMEYDTKRDHICKEKKTFKSKKLDDASKQMIK